MGLPSYRHNPLHGLQLEGIFIGVQHLFQVIMPGGRQRKSDEGWRWGMDHQAPGRTQAKSSPEGPEPGVQVGSGNLQIRLSGETCAPATIMGWIVFPGQKKGC